MRSTKAGAETPATPVTPTCPTPGSSALNEGRGRDPGDTAIGEADRVIMEGAQRRPGPRPRRHACRNCRRPGSRNHALNEGRGRDPGDTGVALNEGRGRDPGDRVTHGVTCAQRRPGPRPRRHMKPHLLDIVVGHLRSTKAGAETPATRDVGLFLEEPRSTKAGAETPATQSPARGDPIWYSNAQRRPGPRPRRHASTVSWSRVGRCPLNEGRGRDPGDTMRRPGFRAIGSGAQRRPGPRPRRHC